MTLEQAIKYFSCGSRLCDAVGVTRQNITAWRRKGYIPYLHQLRLQVMTNGALIAEDPMKHRAQKVELSKKKWRPPQEITTK